MVFCRLENHASMMRQRSAAQAEKRHSDRAFEKLTDKKDKTESVIGPCLILFLGFYLSKFLAEICSARNPTGEIRSKK